MTTGGTLTDEQALTLSRLKAGDRDMETLAQMTWVACCKDAPTVTGCRARRAILAIFLKRKRCGSQARDHAHDILVLGPR